MKRFLVAISLILLVVSISFSLTTSEIEKILTTYDEEGYSFEKKLGDGSWKVKFSSGSWSETVYIYVSPNKSSPDFNIVYVYAGVKSYGSDKELENAIDDIVSAMEVNSSSAEWGCFSLYKEKDVWYLDYNVKLRQKYMDQTQLMNAIGWVSASVARYKKEF